MKLYRINNLHCKRRIIMPTCKSVFLGDVAITKKGLNNLFKPFNCDLGNHLTNKILVNFLASRVF